MNIAGFVAAAEQYPPPTTADGARVVFSYGTAGFRTKGDVLASTVFRCGALAAARSHVTGRATGIVITASHNPEPDNGVKLVDCTGGMLPVAWEAHAEALANADGPDAVASVLERVVAAADPAENLHPPPPPGVAPHPAPPHVFLARDTRPTGPSLAAAAKAGAEAIGAVVTDCGLCTTPQLHWIVRASHRGDPHAEADYFARLAGGFAALVGNRTDDRARPSSDIHVDCANGVGASKLAALAAAAGDALPLRLRNVEGAPGSLNNRVGADHVQKEKSIPAEGGFETLPPGAKCVSVDGDADRLVYFTPGASGSALLFDGDKIAALVATHLADLLARCGDALAPPLRVGVVQTAYANGASTAYVAETLGLETACTPTGVKHLHPEAERFDVGVYFEANGHGTAVFSDDALCRVREAAAKTNARAKEGETNAADAAAAGRARRVDESHQPGGGRRAAGHPRRRSRASRQGMGPRAVERDVHGPSLQTSQGDGGGSIGDFHDGRGATSDDAGGVATRRGRRGGRRGTEGEGVREAERNGRRRAGVRGGRDGGDDGGAGTERREGGVRTRGRDGGEAVSILVPPKRSARENPTSGSRGDSCDIILFLVLGSVVSEFRSSVTARAGPEGKAFCTTRDRARRLRLNVRNTSVRLVERLRTVGGCARESRHLCGRVDPRILARVSEGGNNCGRTRGSRWCRSSPPPRTSRPASSTTS